MPEERTDVYYKLGEMHGDIKAILVEAKRTNGRVTTLESKTVPDLAKRVDKIELRLAAYVGAASVILFALKELADRYL